jgi:ATP-dependent DNA helicase RecG
VSVTLDTPLAKIVGDRSQKAFHKAFGYENVGDLLGHYPRRYATRGELTSIAEIPIGEQATLVAEVVSVSTRPMRQKRGSVLEVVITDGTGGVTLTFFNQAWRQKDLSPGVRGIFAGKIGLYRNSRQLAHPDYELFVDVEPSEEAREDWAKKPIPLYPATSTLASWQIAKAMGVVLDVLELQDEPVPEDIREAEGILGYYESLVSIHRPVDSAQWARAQKSLRFQEALTLQCALVARRQRQRQVAGVTRKPGEHTNAFLASLPFELTEDQVTVVNQIHEDMAAPHPMTRLVQGEVGSGKTVVAACAMVTVSQSGGQTALLAPTEVLANQHFRSLMRTLGPDAARLNPVLLTGSLPVAAKKKALLAAASGASHLIVGTHALLSDAVQFADLGLVVIDEQHRFGVDQREVLRQKGQHPHLLVLTATPIPRTVAMTVFGDLDVSTIATMPEGRSPISSHVVALADHPGWYPRVWQRVGEEVKAGRQVFVVAPAITAAVVEEDTDIENEGEEQGKRPLSTVEETLPLLRGLTELSGMRIEALHGKMASSDKDDVMSAFAAGDIDVLVATTVIEVGIDVPNASLMVILDADRFGVSQLHQLRGRVGRGEHPGTCLLVSHAEGGTTARERVDIVASTLDGFELAAKDLELRSEGDVLGVRQSGVRSRLKLLRVTRDGDVIDAARRYAEALVDKDPRLSGYPALRGDITRRLDEGSEEYLEKT